MSFCSNCGSPLSPDNKFCPSCGTANTTYNSVPPVPVASAPVAPTAPVAPATTIVPAAPAAPVVTAAPVEVEAPINGARIQEFSGKISKCPNCGEVLKALAAKCPACGLELREIANTSSVKEFSEKLANTVSKSQKVELIRNFPIPNAKADIFEFLVLATSNFDTKKHLNSFGAEREISEAWLSKIEQSYVKAEVLFKNDSDFSKFEELYNSDIKELRATEKHRANKKHYFFGTVMMLMSAMLFMILMLKGSGIIANPRLFVTVLAFFANGLISYIFARKDSLKLATFITYCANAVLNLAFCFVAPGHLFHVLIIVACGLGAFIDKKKISKEE